MEVIWPAGHLLQSVAEWAQKPRQHCVLHGRDSVVGGHLLPPHRAATVTLRERLRVGARTSLAQDPLHAPN